MRNVAEPGRRFAAALSALALLAALVLPGPAPLADPVPGTRFERFATTDGHGNALTYYLSEAPYPKPLALVVQGSGCGALFRPAAGGAMNAVGYHGVFRSVAGERYRVLAVEKPGARSPSEPSGGGNAQDCPRRFLAEHTVERWSGALKAALEAARQRTGVIPDRTLVIGHSEGGVAAARLARLDGKISHVALLASPGPDPVEELLLWSEARGRKRPETEATIALIRMKPDSISDFAFGHPYRRWSSFLAADPVADLLASPARIFAAHGEADANWPFAAHLTLVQRLRDAGRAVDAVRLAGADHSLNVPGQRPPEGMAEIFGQILAWTGGGS